MTERLSRVNPQELETRKDLFQLLESTPLKELLAQQQVKWVVKPRLLSKLDIAFIKTKSGNHYLKGLSILGLHHCVGLIMAPDNSVTSVAQTYDNFHHSPEGQDLLDSGYRVAVLTPQDVKLWQDFYQVTADEHLFEQYANRTHELSGLERYSQLEEQKYTKVFHRLLEENWSKLQEIGINTVGAYQSNRDPNLKFDLTFLDKDLQAVLVPMYHVRELLGHNGLLVEKIRSQETLVPGLITRLAGENKRDAYQRAAQMKEAYLAQYPQAGQSLLVPVISGGQVSLWDKLSVFQPLTNVIKVESAVQPALTTDQLLDFLFMGQNSVNRGELGRLGYSLPGNPKAMLANGGDIGVDLLFLKRNSQGKRELVTLDEPVVVEQVVGRDGKVKTKTMNDVAAMTIVPDTWSDEELKAYIKSAQIFLRHHHPDKYAQVLPVTQQLFELWQQRQSIFSPDDKQPQLTVEPEDQNADADLNISPEADAKRTQEDIYLGDQAIASQLFIMLARGEAVVGGNTKLIAENDRDQVNLHVADMGMDFDPKYRSSNSLLNQATTNTGILTHLNDQVIPMIPGLYALEYFSS